MKSPKLVGLKWDASKCSLLTVLEYLVKEVESFSPVDEEDEFKALVLENDAQIKQ